MSTGEESKNIKLLVERQLNMKNEFIVYAGLTFTNANDKSYKHHLIMQAF